MAEQFIGRSYTHASGESIGIGRLGLDTNVSMYIKEKRDSELVILATFDTNEQARKAVYWLGVLSSLYYCHTGSDVPDCLFRSVKGGAMEKKLVE